MRIWFDTEFIDDGRTIELLSIGLVNENSGQCYLENSEADLSRAGEFVRTNVLPSLKGGGFLRSRREIANEICSFVGKDPEFWADFAAYDWVALCQLYGRMIDLPPDWPMFCLDVRHLVHIAGGDRVRLPTFSGVAHDALADAWHCRKIWQYLHTQVDY